MSKQGLSRSFDPGFGQDFAWDIDLVEGYSHEFLDVVAGRAQDSFWWLRLKPGCLDVLRRAGAQALWIQGWQVAAYWQAVWQAHGTGIPVWLRGETNLRSSGRGWGRHIKDRLLSRMFARVDRFLCIGEANRQFYLSHGIDPGRFASAPYCVDNARFSQAAQELRRKRSQLRAAWGVPSDAFCLLFVGKLINKKRPLDLMAAAEMLGTQMPHVRFHLLFVGAGELLEAALGRCNISHSFHRGAAGTSRHRNFSVDASFLGFLNQGEIAKAYVAADCLVLPSDATETWGLVVNEALACGLPAVVSDACGCCDDLVRPFRPDLCFPAGNPAALAAAVQACIARPPLPSELQHIIGRNDVLRTVETVETLYTSMLAQSCPVRMPI